MRNPALAILLAVLPGCRGEFVASLSDTLMSNSAVCASLPPADRVVRQGPLRRLTRLEYVNSVADLVGESVPESALVSDLPVRGFDANTYGSVTELVADKYLELAQRVAASAAPRLAQEHPCPDGAGGVACVQSFCRSFGLRVFRRPLSEDEVTRLAGLYNWARVEEQQDHSGGLRMVVAALFASPHFRYQFELGAGTGEGPVVALSQFELASRISYFLWNSTPDEALLDAAAAGRLSSPKLLEQEARRMLDHPRAREAVWPFYRQWLEVGALESAAKDPVAFPEYSASLVKDMLAETQELTRRVTFQGPQGFSALLTSNKAFVTPELASLYGMTLSTGPQTVELNSSERSGVLTQASILAGHAKALRTSPVLRGQLVRSRLMCTDIPPPPANVDTGLPETTDPGLTQRERLASHTTNPSCAGCHQLMDPIGFGLEEYDAIGRFRPVVDGAPVDSAGEVTHTDDMNGEFRGAIELSRRLSASEQAKECFTLQWWSYGLGRDYREVDACSRAQALDRFRGSDGDLREMIVGIVSANGFRFIRTGAP